MIEPTSTLPQEYLETPDVHASGHECWVPGLPVVIPGAPSGEVSVNLPLGAEPSPTSFRSPHIRPVTAQGVSLARNRQARSEPFVAPEGRQSPAYVISKRLFDVAGALAALVLLSPILVTVFWSF